MPDVPGEFRPVVNGYLNIESMRTTEGVEGEVTSREITGSLTLVSLEGAFGEISRVENAKTLGSDQASHVKTLVTHGLVEANNEEIKARNELERHVVRETRLRARSGVVGGMAMGTGLYRALFEHGNNNYVTGGLLGAGVVALIATLSGSVISGEYRSNKVSSLSNATRKQQLFTLASQENIQFVPVETRQTVEATE